MRIYLNNGHPIASLDGLALEVEAVAGAVESVSMLVRPTDRMIDETTVTEEQIDGHFRCIESMLYRIATDLHIYFEQEQEAENAAAEKIRHLPVTDPDDENYISDSEIEGMIAERWGKDWDLRYVDPDDCWVKEYMRRIAYRSLEK